MLQPVYAGPLGHLVTTILCLFSVVACSRSEKMGGGSSTSLSQDLKPGPHQGGEQVTSRQGETDPEHTGNKDVLFEEDPSEPGQRKKAPYSSQSSTEVALEPFAISASIEGEIGPYYYFEDESPSTSLRIACRSVRGPSGTASPATLSIPCVLVTKGQQGNSWVHSSFDQNLYQWTFGVDRCPQASLKGTNLFPQVATPHLLTPATVVHIPASSLNYCVQGLTVLSLSVRNRSSQEVHTFRAQLKILNQNLISILEENLISSERDTAEGMVLIEDPPFFAYSRIAASMGQTQLNLSPLRHSRQFTIRSLNGGDEPTILCSETKNFGFSVADDSMLFYMICRPRLLPPIRFTRWKVLITHCPSIHSVGNTMTDPQTQTSGGFTPGALLMARAEDLRQCMKSKNVELIFYVETEQKDRTLLYRGVMEEIRTDPA